MDILQQLNQIAIERDIPLAQLQLELEDALTAAYKRYVGAVGEVSVKIDATKGFDANVEKEVVAIVSEPSFQIGLLEARKRDPEAVVGDKIPVKIDPNLFGRIAASTFKQVLSQKLREAETKRVNDVFNEKMGELITGQVSRKEGSSVYIQVNRVEAEPSPARAGPHGAIPAQRHAQGVRLQGGRHPPAAPRHRLADPPEPSAQAFRAGGSGDRQRGGRHQERGPRARAAQQGRGLLHRRAHRPDRGLHRAAGGARPGDRGTS